VETARTLIDERELVELRMPKPLRLTSQFAFITLEGVTEPPALKILILLRKSGAFLRLGLGSGRHGVGLHADKHRTGAGLSWRFPQRNHGEPR
jgi:hypothetical protein